MPRVFEGQTFYLARSLHTDDRKKAKSLILTHGGNVTTDTRTKNAKTVVDKRALASNNNPGTWLPVELIYESVELGELQPLAKYYQTPEQKGKEIRRKLKYTVEEDVAMLDFLEKQNGGRLPAVNESVPIGEWEIAATLKVTKHSAASMNEHYRKILNKWTPKERRNAIENAQKLEASREDTARPVEASVSSSSPSTKPPSLAYRENEVAEASQAVAEDVNAVEMSTRAQEKQGGVQDQPTPAEIGTAIRSKLKFTDEDDARMLYFVQRRNGGQMPPESKSISLTWWKIAASLKVTEHSAESMRHHYPAIYKKFTPTEIRNVIEKAKLSQLQKETEKSNIREEDTSTTDKLGAISSPKSKANTPVTRDSNDSVDTEDLSEPARKRKKKTRAISSASEQSATNESEQLPSEASITRADKPERAKDADPRDRALEDGANVSDDASDMEESENRMEEFPGGMLIHSYWEKRLAEATREELSRYLHPRKPALSSVTNEQPRNETQQASEEAAVSTLSKRRHRSNGLIPPSHVKATKSSVVTIRDEAEKLISRIQLETGQNLDIVVHALYFTSGDVDATISFLRGSSAPVFWNAGDDVVLESWAREHDTPPTAVVIGAALEKGELAALSTPQSAEAILKRLNFLL